MATLRPPIVKTAIAETRESNGQRVHAGGGATEPSTETELTVRRRGQAWMEACNAGEPDKLVVLSSIHMTTGRQAAEEEKQAC